MKLKLLIATLVVTPFVYAASLNDGLRAINGGKFKEAYAILKPIAEEGNSQAQYNLGVMYRDGYGVKENCELSKKWFLESAKQGDVNAQYNYARLHNAGAGKPYDLKVAAKWYKGAANKNHVGAMHNIGIMYQYGEGVSKDLNKAKKHLTHASKKGHSASSYQLGVMYFTEEPMKDFVISLAWLKKSKNSGYIQADSAIQIVLKSMSQEQIMKANKLVSEL